LYEKWLILKIIDKDWLWMAMKKSFPEKILLNLSFLAYLELKFKRLFSGRLCNIANFFVKVERDYTFFLY